MTQLNVLPEGLIAASAQVAALTGRLPAPTPRTRSRPAPSCRRARPAVAKVAASLIGQGAAHQAAAAMGNEELGRSSMGVAESGISYLIGDAEGATAFGAAAGVEKKRTCLYCHRLAAAPPEVHSTLLNFGGTPAGIAAAGASWTQLAAQYAAGIAELEGILAQVQAQYQGPSAEQFVAAHQPMLLWMADVFAKSLIAASAHSEVVAAYEGSVVAMPTLGELAENHIVHGVLVSTNFFGVNTIPIGMNEADYIRMWNLAADVMAGWDGASTAAADSVPLTPTSPILLLPGVGESGAAAASAASFWTQAEGQAAGAALNGADMMGTKLLVGKAATSPASAADGAAPSPRRRKTPRLATTWRSRD